MSRELRLLGVRVTAQRFDDAIARILEAAGSRTSFRAHFCTVHSLIAATKEPGLATVFDTASMVCTDGMPLVWLARRHGATAERVAGPDALPVVCDRGRVTGLRHYFVGGEDGVAARLATRLERRYPGLRVSGTLSPPFRPMSDQEIYSLCRTIRETRTNVVWIGLGAPKQEYFAARLQAALPGAVLLPIGAAFDFHSGRRRRAPSWMRQAGLEWLFRLGMEPRRLLRRYVLTNGEFLLLVVRDLLKRLATKQ